MPITAPRGAKEITELRNIRSKVYDLGNGRKRVAAGMTVLHVPKDVQAWVRGEGVAWDEIDETPVWDEAKQKYVVTRAWYELEVDPDRFFATYRSKITGRRVTVELMGLDGGQIGGAQFRPKIDGKDVVFEDVQPGLDLLVRTHKHGIETFKRIKNAAAPKSFEWEFTEEDGPQSHVNFETRGWDNERMDDADRSQQPRKRRAVEIQTARANRTKKGNVWTERYTETWTGKSVNRDPDSRVLSLSSDIKYPVLIDATINEAVTANNDDGTDSTGPNTWSALNHYYYGGRCYALQYATRQQTGWRFQGVTGIGSGDTVDSATLTFNVNSVGGGGVTATIYGYDVDSSDEWSNSVRPEVVAHTTASVSQAMTTTGVKNVDVATIIQEIVDRAGWASGNNISLFVDGGSGTGSARLDEVEATLNQEATLVIEYTSAGGGAERTPSVGAVSLSGYAPVLTHQITIKPASGVIEVSGYQPTSAAPTLVTPQTGALSFTGYVGPQTLGVPTVQPGSLVIEGFAPSVNISMFRGPQVGSVALAGLSPQINISEHRAPAVGAISIAGYAPLVSQQHIRTPGTGSISIDGYSPVTAGEGRITPQSAGLSIDGSAPVISMTVTITPQTGSLAVEGAAPSLDGSVTITPQTGSLGLEGSAPLTGAAVLIVPDVAALALTGYAPALRQGTTRTPQTGALSLTGAAPAIGGDHYIVVPSGSLVLLTKRPEVANSGAPTVGIPSGVGGIGVGGDNVDSDYVVSDGVSGRGVGG